MKYNPKNKAEEQVKKLISVAIKKGVKNFWKPRVDLLYATDCKGIGYVSGIIPTVDMSYNGHAKVGKEFYTERNSRLGLKLEYDAFIGVLIKKLIDEGKTERWVWNAVCCNFRELLRYWNSENTKHTFTGSKAICGFDNLTNVYKILAWDDDANGFLIAGGICNSNGD